MNDNGRDAGIGEKQRSKYFFAVTLPCFSRYDKA